MTAKLKRPKKRRQKTFDYCGKRYGLGHYLIGFMLGGAVGFLISEIMYGNTAVNAVFAAVFGLIGARSLVKHLIERRRRQFSAEFSDFLDSVGSSLSCGKNTYEAFITAKDEMLDLYKTDSPIAVESSRLADGLKSGRSIKELLGEMAERSGSEDVRTFGEVYSICNTAGGNLKKIINDTKAVISEKLEIEAEIHTSLAEPKNELYVMSVMPLAITMALKTLGGQFSGDNSVVVNSAALAVFFVAHLWGRKIVSIRV